MVPAIFYAAFNYQHADLMKGWAIPAATDIAFALGVLTLLGNRVPAALKVFLASIAIFDDIGAIIIIALFYSSGLSMAALAWVGVCLVILWLMNRFNVTRTTAYIMIGVLLWAAMLKSGLHATLAGVLLALFIPMTDNKHPEHSPSNRLNMICKTQSVLLFYRFLRLPMRAFISVVRGYPRCFTRYRSALPWGCYWVNLLG